MPTDFRTMLDGHTVYVRHEGKKMIDAFAGGDYTKITNKLTDRQKQLLQTRVNIRG